MGFIYVSILILVCSQIIELTVTGYCVGQTQKKVFNMMDWMEALIQKAAECLIFKTWNCA